MPELFQKLRRYFAFWSDGPAPLLRALWVWGTGMLIVGALFAVPAALMGNVHRVLAIKLLIAIIAAMVLRPLSFPED